MNTSPLLLIMLADGYLKTESSSDRSLAASVDTGGDMGSAAVVKS